MFQSGMPVLVGLFCHMNRPLLAFYACLRYANVDRPLFLFDWVSFEAVWSLLRPFGDSFEAFLGTLLSLFHTVGKVIVDRHLF